VTSSYLLKAADDEMAGWKKAAKAEGVALAVFIRDAVNARISGALKLGRDVGDYAVTGSASHGGEGGSLKQPSLPVRPAQDLAGPPQTDFGSKLSG
jgi:hypothetical protein